MALVEGLRKVYDMVVDGIRGDYDPEDAFVIDENEGYEEEYVEEGGALRQVEPTYTPIFERKAEPKVINHPSMNRGVNNIVVVEPRSFEDAATIVQHLKDRKIVMLNLHLLDKEQSQRTIDFICGASQALNANPKKVADLVFVFAPSNVTLTADTNPQLDKFNDSLWRTALQ